jgi:hypothetical protein
MARTVAETRRRTQGCWPRVLRQHFGGALRVFGDVDAVLADAGGIDCSLDGGRNTSRLRILRHVLL